MVRPDEIPDTTVLDARLFELLLRPDEEAVDTEDERDLVARFDTSTVRFTGREGVVRRLETLFVTDRDGGVEDLACTDREDRPEETTGAVRRAGCDGAVRVLDRLEETGGLDGRLDCCGGVVEREGRLLAEGVGLAARVDRCELTEARARGAGAGVDDRTD